MQTQTRTARQRGSPSRSGAWAAEHARSCSAWQSMPSARHRCLRGLAPIPSPAHPLAHCSRSCRIWRHRMAIFWWGSAAMKQCRRPAGMRPAAPTLMWRGLSIHPCWHEQLWWGTCARCCAPSCTLAQHSHHVCWGHCCINVVLPGLLCEEKQVSFAVVAVFKPLRVEHGQATRGK